MTVRWFKVERQKIWEQWVTEVNRTFLQVSKQRPNEVCILVQLDELYRMVPRFEFQDAKIKISQNKSKIFALGDLSFSDENFLMQEPVPYWRKSGRSFEASPSIFLGGVKFGTTSSPKAKNLGTVGYRSESHISKSKQVETKRSVYSCTARRALSNGTLLRILGCENKKFAKKGKFSHWVICHFLMKIF